MPCPDSLQDLALGVIRAEGPDAAAFLRAQLTNDVFRLGPDRHFLAGWCDAKGRTQLVLRVAATEDAFLLILPRSLIEASLKRLRMFVLRLDVQLTDVSQTCPVHGVLGSESAPAVDETRRHADTLHLGLPPTMDGTRRMLVLGQDTPADASPLATDSPAWQLAEIDAGMPQIGPDTQGEFVPQMLNLHWLMAIDFDKGCYPGQEVIARLHYRGRLTRRVFRLSFEGQPPTPGSALVAAEGSRAGTVLQAVADESEQGRMLAVVGVEAANSPLVTEQSAETRLLDLPYPTPD